VNTKQTLPHTMNKKQSKDIALASKEIEQLVHVVRGYLLQHANNPVDWRPWGPAALAKARKGSSTCFWQGMLA
jgi:hypothetical protein